MDSSKWIFILIASFCKTAFYYLYNIRRIRKFLNSECTKIIFNAFVTSRLDFCNSLLYGLPNNQLRKLQRVHWLSINYRIKFKILLFVYKALNGIAPSYISDLFKLKPASRYNLRSSIDTLLLKHPNFKSLSTLGDRSFKCAGPKLWNELPKDIRNATTVQIFKRLLKTYLFKNAFNVDNS